MCRWADVWFGQRGAVAAGRELARQDWSGGSGLAAVAAGRRAPFVAKARKKTDKAKGPIAG